VQALHRKHLFLLLLEVAADALQLLAQGRSQVL
jgi:hypothetical protein